MTQPDPLANATLAEMETFAAGLLPTNALDYYASGARDEQTFQGNLAAWERWWLVPRMLIDVSTGLPRDDDPRPSDRPADHGRADGLAADGASGRRARHGPGGRRGRARS